MAGTYTQAATIQREPRQQVRGVVTGRKGKAVEVEKGAGTLIAWGLVASVLGGAVAFWGLIQNEGLPSQGSDGGPLILGGLIGLLGLGLLATGIAKVVRNIEINTIANASAEDHLRRTEEHVRSIRWVVATQYNEERGLTHQPRQ